MSGTEGRRAGGALVVAVVCALVGAGCGSRLPRERLARSLGSLEGLRPAGSSGAPAGALPSPGAGAAGTAAGSGGGGALPSAPGTGSGAGGGATGAEIRLGSFGVQSGILGATMAPFFQGARAWVADVTARGGLNGHPVRLILGDDGGDPAKTQALVRRMVEQDKVQAFYTVAAPTTLQAATPYLE